MSVRVVRWDTGREAEVPDEALRWGPDTRQGTCRAALLRGGYADPHAGKAARGDVPYVLPFSGAKWAVRVTLGEELQVAAVLPHGAKVRAFAFPGSGAAGRAPFGGSIHHLSDRAFLEHCGTSREKLGALLDAAGDALRAEEERPLKGRHAPTAERYMPERPAIPLERETSSRGGPSRLREAQELLALVLDCELTAPAGSYAFIQPDILRAEICAFLERETAAEIRQEWKGAGRG